MFGLIEMFTTPVLDSPASVEEDRLTSILSSVFALPIGSTGGELSRLVTALLAYFFTCLHDRGCRH